MSWARPLICATALATLTFAPSAAAARSLPPATALALKNALQSVQSCRIDSIRVEGDLAVVRLCLESSPVCFSVQLDDPEPGCDGDETGPWCVHWIEGDPPASVSQAVREALRNAPSTWIRLDFVGRPPELERGDGAPARRPLQIRTWALGLGLVGGPLLLGIVIGRALSRLRWHWLAVALALAADIALAVRVVESMPHVGAWDIVSVAALTAIGLLLGAAPLDWRAALALTISSAVALAALEWAVRRWLPPPATFPSPEEASFLLRPGGWDIGCGPLFGAAGVDQELAQLRDEAAPERHKSGPLVVHLGDSMTFGTGVHDGEAFPELLDRRHPGVVHANYGVWAVGTDFEYLLLQRILAAHTPALVVLHVFLGNDVYEIDRPYECCEMGPLLAYPPSGPTPRCSTARWGFTLAAYLGRSPPPYPLRVATASSYAARHAAAAFSRLEFQLDPPPHFISGEGKASEQGWEHFAQILATMRDELAARGVEFIVDLLPNRSALEVAASDPASDETRRRAAAIAAQLGIRTVDAWDVLAEAVRRDGARRYFIGEHDIHFTPEGHRLLAEWLDRQLPPVAGAGSHADQSGAKNPNGTPVAS